MFVQLKHHGKGIAVDILKELEQWAVEESYKLTILEIGFKQPESIRLYEKSDHKVIDN